MIDVAPFRDSDLAAVAELFNQTTAILPYHWQLEPQRFRELVLFSDGAPDAELAVDAGGWLAARVGDRLVGFAHCTVGRFATDERDVRRGFLRYLTVAPKAHPQTVATLLMAADAYFRRQHVHDILAFAIRTGYACYLAGRGVLVGGNVETMSALGRAGYRMSERWLLYETVLTGYVSERLPQPPKLTLKISAPTAGSFSFTVNDRSEVAAELVCAPLIELSEHSIPTASLRTLCVAEPYRLQGLGRWLLLRCLNELTTRGFQRLVVDINHADAATQALLQHQGFEELPLSGYSYEKRLP